MALKNMSLEQGLISTEKEKNKEEINHCPVCGIDGKDGALCDEHVLLTKDFSKLRAYINEQEKAEPRFIYMLDFAISDRKSYVINYVPIVNGKMMIEEFLKSKNCSEFSERICKEILILQRAKCALLDMIESDKLKVVS